MQKLRCLCLIGLVFLCAVCLAACGSFGSTNLSKSRVDDIIIGKTTKDEVKASLGYPDGGVMFMDKPQLEAYIYQRTLNTPPPDMFSPDKYEVWQYHKYSYVANPIPFVNLVASGVGTDQSCFIIFGSNGICFQKIYGSNSEVK